MCIVRTSDTSFNKQLTFNGNVHNTSDQVSLIEICNQLLCESVFNPFVVEPISITCLDVIKIGSHGACALNIDPSIK